MWHVLYQCKIVSHVACDLYQTAYVGLSILRIIEELGRYLQFTFTTDRAKYALHVLHVPDFWGKICLSLKMKCSL